MSPFSHIIVFSFLFFIFYCLTQVRQLYLNRNWWICIFIPILLYAFIVGSRYGWGPDYDWYKLRFENPNYYVDEDPGWRSLNLFLGSLGFNYVGAYIVYSLVFIFGCGFLLQSYKYNKYMLFLFVLVTIEFSTLAVRQAFAHSFVFIAMFFMNKKWKIKWLLVAFTIPVIFSIHPAALITLLFLLLFYIINKPIPLKLALMIYIILSVFARTVSFWASAKLPEYVQLLPFMETKFVGYADNGERWFGESAMEEERVQSLSAFLLSVIYYCCIIYMCSICLKYKPNKYISYVYNVVFVGFCGIRVFMLFEILVRIMKPMECLIFIPLGYSISLFRSKSFSRDMSQYEHKMMKLSIKCICIYLVLYYGRFLFFSSEKGFVWD